jgi:hypothetical protein
MVSFSVISICLQTSSELLQAVAVAAGGGVGGDFEQGADFLEGVLVPDFEDDDLPLGLGEVGEAAHGVAFGGGFFGIAFEPAAGFEFAGEAAPEAAAAIEGAIAEGPEAVVLGLGRGFRPAHQGDEGFLQDVLGFAVAQAEGAAVQDETGSFGCV